MTARPPESASSPAALRIAVAAWALLITLPLTFLAASHALALPAHTTGQMPVVESAGWQAIHILAPDCPCSEYVTHCLALRGARAGLQETALVLGEQPEWQRELSARGFSVESRDAGEFAALTGIQGGPWLVLIRPDHSIAYSGGYSAQRPRPGVELADLALWQRAQAGETPEPFLSYGCAASPSLKHLFDPSLALTALSPFRQTP